MPQVVVNKQNVKEATEFKELPAGCKAGAHQNVHPLAIRAAKFGSKAYGRKQRACLVSRRSGLVEPTVQATENINCFPQLPVG